MNLNAEDLLNLVADMESFQPSNTALTELVSKYEDDELSEEALSYVAAAAATPVPFQEFLKQHQR